MSALARAREHLTAARHELEAAASEVPYHDLEHLRFLSAEVQATRVRVEGIQAALGVLHAEPPAAG